MATKIGFVKEYTLQGTDIVLPYCFWALGSTYRKFNPDQITSLETPKEIRQDLVPYKDLASFVSSDMSVNKPLPAAPITVVIEYTINELNEAGMQDKLVARIQANNEYFSDAQIVEI